MCAIALGGGRLSTTLKLASSPAERGGLWCKCLTAKEFFAVIVGFPDLFQRYSMGPPVVMALRAACVLAWQQSVKIRAAAG